MNSADHVRNQCRHGVVVSQCRCIAPGKRIIIVPCPSYCPDREES